MGAMSVSGNDGMHSPYTGYMPMQFTVDIPSDELAFNEYDALLKSQKGQIAAVIIEPLVQGAGGMKFHSADVLGEIYRITKKHEILFIADEIATGFGRSGYMFACAEAGITPDIMCVGKGLTGGMLGMAATCASAEIFEKFLSDKHEQALMHGPTFMANPLACAAANASLDLFEREPRLEQVAKIESIMQEELAKCEELPMVKDVRVKGAFGVVQLNSNNKEEDNKLMLELRKKFVNEGVWLRPFGDIVYLAPPFVISEKELKILTDAVFKVLSRTNRY
jgi:adenosylmethionine-8-amino-7-oxononanoate aminotransferase